MADPPTPGISTIPTAVPIVHPSTGAGPSNEQPADGPSTYDYTEKAPQAVVDAIAIERAREEKEGPGEMMVGSFSSWAGTMDGGSDFSSLSNPDPSVVEAC
jgi:cation-transporting ATPase 13A2